MTVKYIIYCVISALPSVQDKAKAVCTISSEKIWHVLSTCSYILTTKYALSIFIFRIYCPVLTIVDQSILSIVSSLNSAHRYRSGPVLPHSSVHSLPVHAQSPAHVDERRPLTARH